MLDLGDIFRWNSKPPWPLLYNYIRILYDAVYMDLTVKITLLFTAFVRPTLEYSNAVWRPFFVLDQRKVEKVQGRTTRLLPSLRDKPYEVRLETQQLPSLAHRSHRGDMILLYKITNNYFNSDFSTLYTYSNNTITRGHQFKLFKYHSRYFLIN